MAWREVDSGELRVCEARDGNMVPIPVVAPEIPTNVFGSAPLLVAQANTAPMGIDAAPATTVPSGESETPSPVTPAPVSIPAPAPLAGSPAGADAALPITDAALPITDAVRKIADQIRVDPAELSVHSFATFSVVEHPASGRNWVLAKPSRNSVDEGWKLASIGDPANSPISGSGGAGPSPAPSGVEVAVVEVSPDGVGSEPKLLSELDAPDQVAMAAPPSDAPYIGASLEPPVDSGPAVIPSGFVQLGGTYHSNVHLTDEEVDYDLVRHNDTDTEIDDFLYQAAVGLRLDLNPRLAENTYFEYVGALDFFDSETGENRWRHSLEFNTRGESGELLDLWWRGGIIFHDQLRQDEAEYLAQDYMEFWVTPGLDFFLSDKDTLSLSTPLFYRNVSKDGLPNKTLGPPPTPGGGDVPPAQGGIAPKSDIERYADHVGFGVDGTWRRRFSENLETRLRVAYLRRQYDRPALDEYGSIFGCDSAGCTKEIYRDRQDDLFETSLGYTWVLCPETALGMSYRFRNNASNGDFYDFYEHGMRLVANHTIFHGRWCEANLSLVGDVAWRTWRARKADTLNTLLLPPISGPDGLLTRGYDEDTRDDLTYIARLGFDRQFGSYTVGTFYQFEANDSNDGSGDYKDHGVGGFVRLEY